MNLNIFVLFISLAVFTASPISGRPQPCFGLLPGRVDSTYTYERNIDGKNYAQFTFSFKRFWLEREQLKLFHLFIIFIPGNITRTTVTMRPFLF